MNQANDWYIEYDFKTFSILQKPNFQDLIYDIAQNFGDVVGPPKQYIEDSQYLPKWIQLVAEAFTQISILLYNFFYVQEKLSSKSEVKKLFSKIFTVLRVQKQYSKYFFTMSKNFRINRILAVCLRLSQFIQAIFKGIQGINKSLDKTLVDNLNEVYLFMQQKIQETLSVTYQLGDNQLNIIMLDMLSMLLRNTGDPTIHKILDQNKKKSILNSIQQQNQINEEYQIKKLEQRHNFQINRAFSARTEIDEDPKLRKSDFNDNSEYGD